MRRALLALPLVLLIPLFAACEKPDASFQTSPSALALVGTTTGNVAYDVTEAPPPPVDPPDGWEVELGNARFTELENGTPAIQVILSIRSRPGLGMELWLARDGQTVARWSGGSSADYSGTVCWQMKTQSGSEALQLQPGDYTMSLVFRDVEAGPVIVREAGVTGLVPNLKGSPPGPNSEVFRDLLGCPRGS